MPDSVKSIECGGYAEQGAFAECPELKSVSIGKSIETISPHAFRTTGEELAITFREGVTAIPEHALDKAPVTSLILPQTVTAISAEMISGCGSLKEIEIQAYDCDIEDSEKTIPASAVIKALDGSTAQKHAEKYQLAFESTLMQGDLNGDKVVSVEDAQLVLNAYTEALAGKEMNLNAAQIKAGDVDGNGTISVEDAQYILTYYTEMTITGKAITWKDILPQKSV